MANEDKKDFNAMLHDSKDMPKIQTITDEKSIKKYGGDRMYFAPPIAYDEVMRRVPLGKLLTVGTIRDYFAKQSGADFTEPITAGIFVSIVAWASHQRENDETPYWRTLKANGELNAKLVNSGYICMSEEENRKSFNKGYTDKGFAERVFHVHLRYDGDNDELYFRDYMNSHPELAKEYEKLKLSLWKKYEHNRDVYTDAKSTFVGKYTECAKTGMSAIKNTI